MPHFHHLVLFKLHEGADADAAMAALNDARPVSGLVSWQVERSLDERKGTVIAQMSVFDSVDAFHAWRDSERHQAAATHLREVADWLVADWEAS